MAYGKAKQELRNVSVLINGMWRQFSGVNYRFVDGTLRIINPGKQITVFPLDAIEEIQIPHPDADAEDSFGGAE